MSQFNLNRQLSTSQREFPPAEEMDEPPTRRSRRQRLREENRPEYARERPITTGRIPGRIPTGSKRRRDDLQPPSMPLRAEVQIVTSDIEPSSPRVPSHRLPKRVVSASERVINSFKQLIHCRARLNSPVSEPFG